MLKYFSGYDIGQINERDIKKATEEFLNSVTLKF